MQLLCQGICLGSKKEKIAHILIKLDSYIVLLSGLEMYLAVFKVMIHIKVTLLS